MKNVSNMMTVGTKVPRNKVAELRALAEELEYPSLSDLVRAAMVTFLETQSERLKNGQRLRALEESILMQARTCPVAHLLFIEGTSGVTEAELLRAADRRSRGRKAGEGGGYAS